MVAPTKPASGEAPSTTRSDSAMWPMTSWTRAPAVPAPNTTGRRVPATGDQVLDGRRSSSACSQAAVCGWDHTASSAAGRSPPTSMRVRAGVDTATQPSARTTAARRLMKRTTPCAVPRRPAISRAHSSQPRGASSSGAGTGRTAGSAEPLPRSASR